MVEWFILPSANGAAIIQPRASPDSARGVALGKTRKETFKAPTGRNNRRDDPKIRRPRLFYASFRAEKCGAEKYQRGEPEAVFKLRGGNRAKEPQDVAAQQHRSTDAPVRTCRIFW